MAPCHDLSYWFYVSGIYLEGATWNCIGGFLDESRPMELISTMPIIHFKPVEGKRRAAKGYYSILY
ncbi:MAG: hypothetical protein JSR97_10315 [Verrucomicrobia bacterium]|nr:hypothetical protein [Verrucomicrobiota bacterium]